MTSFTDEDILQLDHRYAQEGVPFHARPFRAAVDLLKDQFVLGLHQNPAIEGISHAYARLVPEVNYTWPGMGTGLAAAVDQVKKFTIGVGYGQFATTPHQGLGFDNHEAWSRWCRGDRMIAARSCFAWADAFDLVYSIDDLQHQVDKETLTLWGQAASNLEDVANTLVNTYNSSSIIQPICLTAELVIKGTLKHLGVSEKDRRGLGHKHEALANRLIAECPHRDDQHLLVIAKKLPDYVNTRYQGAGLTRLEVIDLALDVQFIAASALRRVSTRDLALQLEQDVWPGPRP
ncbi:hypothetical protein ABXR30_005201 [Pseudomonas aeruginosa]|jgi:hypothetical protein